MIINLRHGGANKKPPKFNYTGEYEYIDEGDGNWKVKFLTSGILTFNTLGNARDVDFFGVGSGSKGKNGRAGSSVTFPGGGDGGNGGECVTKSLIRLAKPDVIKITIEPEQDTVITKNDSIILSAKTGGGAKGGYGSSSTSPGKDGQAGSPEFGEAGKPLYGGGAGGGAESSLGKAGKGKDGGGNGGDKKPTPGKANTGGGGGGGYGAFGSFTPGAPGGTGIGIMRNHREN